jgi:hypothetical protein
MQGLDIVLPDLAAQQKIIAGTVLAQQILAKESELAKIRKQYAEQALLQYARGTLPQVAAA